MAYETWNNHCTFLLVDFPSHKDQNEHTKADQESYNLAAVPGMCLAPILQRKDKRNNQSHHKSCTDEVHLQELFFGCSLCRGCTTWGLEEQEDQSGSQSPDGQVDVEALFSGQL